jgi:DNA-binding PadR family transcriptional regulator
LQQEVVLAMLVKEPSQGSQLRTRLDRALYVTLSRLEKAGLITRHQAGAPSAERKVYQLTPAGQERVTEWLSDLSRPKPNLAEFHLKLIAAAQAELADPIGIVDRQRHALLRRLRDGQRAAMAEPDHSDAGLLLEGIVLRLQADLRRLDACEATWTRRRGKR